MALHEKYSAMGSDSLWHLLRPKLGCSHKRVHRQMRLAGVPSVRRRAYKTATNFNHSHPAAPNLLRQNFSFQRPDRTWRGDITYIPTRDGRSGKYESVWYTPEHVSQRRPLRNIPLNNAHAP